MAKKPSWQISVCLLAALFFEMPLIRPSFSREPHRHLHKVHAIGAAVTPGRARRQSEDSTVQRTSPSSENVQAKSADGVNTQDRLGAKQPPSGKRALVQPAVGLDSARGTKKSTETNGQGRVESLARDVTPIDTSVTVEQPGRSGETGTAYYGKTVWKASRRNGLPVARAQASGPKNPVVRNAIGLRVTSREVIRAPAGRSTPAPAILAGRFGGNSGIVSTTNLTAPNASAAGASLLGARIDGAFMVRPDVSTLGLGGPARPVVAGINGATVRPKR